MDKVCVVVGCGRQDRVTRDGLCSKHYQRLRNSGCLDDPVRSRIPDEQRFWAKVIKQDCWLWTARKNPGGYGTFKTYAKKTMLAHRWAFLAEGKEIPEGLFLDHLCQVRHCVNPDHLEPVTIRENTLRSPIAPAAINARKTHCFRGHPFSEENTRRIGNRRWCRACQKIRASGVDT